ncbi:hypothetical protein [Rhodopseudomonas palustris]|uniref:hypothetical protein n=1 Tax=Rhodopseudomonas palustris TaxID=1076 RepID=UPI0021F32750|nr:hypothetical protein [Rhodopseudomonas palustris]UYO55199.1 hypothetical protein KQX61_07290 [Rhodopseudomonas palustris]
MVKKAKMGRPPIPEDKVRTARIAIRAHQDLVDALDEISENVGLVRSVLVERAVIAFVNEHYGMHVLNGIGKRNAGISGLVQTVKSIERQERQPPAEWVTNPRLIEERPNSQRIHRPKSKK